MDDQRVGERIREGFKISIIGPTNVGKSSLLNHLANREVAIVSEIAGTTRDVIETHLNWMDTQSFYLTQLASETLKMK